MLLRIEKLFHDSKKLISETDHKGAIVLDIYFVIQETQAMQAKIHLTEPNVDGCKVIFLWRFLFPEPWPWLSEEKPI